MKLRDALVIGAVSLALTGCNEKADETQATAAEPAQELAAKKDCSQCESHKAPAETQPAATTPAVATEQAAAPAADAQLMQDAASLVAASVGTFTVEELYAKKAELNGKVVTVKGEVVKVSNGIMGRSWVHVQDGTGSEGTNDMTFTSVAQTANVGDKIVATGTFAADKDFGYGYLYSAIVENSVFSMQ